MNMSPSLLSILLATVMFGPAWAAGTPSVTQPVQQDSARQVTFDTARMLAMQPNTLIYLPLPGEGALPVVFEHTTGMINGVAYWEGHLPDKLQRRVSLKYDGAGWSGVIDGHDRRWVVGHANGQTWLTPVGNDYQRPTVPQAINLFARVADAQGAPLAFAGEPPAKVVHPLSLNLDALLTLQENSEVSLNLPGQPKPPVLVFERTEATESGNTNWIGYLRDWGTDYRVVLTYGRDGVFGRILTPDGEFLLESNGRQQWLVDVAASGLDAHQSLSPDAILPAAQAADVMASASKTRSSSSGSKASSSSMTSAAAASTSDVATVAVVDVLVLFTDGLASRLGVGLTARLDNLFAQSNQAFIDSNIKMKLRMVAGKQVVYSDTTNNSVALSDLYGRRHAAFQDVATLRDATGADLVTLIRPFHASAQVSCGVGYIGGYNGSPIANAAGYAYSVVSDGRDVKGSSYYCVDQTMVHEFGHNMGSMHDRTTVRSQGGGQGAFPYSFGYGQSGKFGTIMSYINPRISKFSNPAVKTCASLACGVSETDLANSANNALSLTNVRLGVAAFRPTRSTAASRFRLNGVVTFNGTGLARVTFTSSDTAAYCGTSGSNGAFSCSAPSGWAGTLTPVLSGYRFSPTRIALTTVLADQTNLVIRASK